MPCAVSGIFWGMLKIFPFTGWTKFRDYFADWSN